LFFKSNLISKEDFDLILKIKQNLLENEEKIHKTKETFKENFKKKFKYMKENQSYRSLYDAKFSCLFGNGILI